MCGERPFGNKIDRQFMLQKSKKLDFKYIILLVCIASFLVILFTETFEYRPRSQIFPLLIIPLTFALILTEIIRYILSGRISSGKSGFIEEDQEIGLDESNISEIERHRKQLRLMSWMFGYIFLIVLFGFLPGSSAFVLLFLHFEGDLKIKTTIGTTVLIILFIYIVFVFLLDTPFYGGIFRDSLQEAMVR